MQSARLSILLPVLLLAPGLPEVVPGPADVEVEIREWEVPYAESRPRDPYVGPDGRVWFVGQRTHYVAVLDPESGEFTQYDLEEGTGPHNLIVADDGTIWYAGNRAAHIGRLDPETGEITKYPMPDPAARDPHTLVFAEDGTIWFTVQGGNFVGHFAPASGDVHLIEVPTPRARPYGIVVAPDGRPWIALFGTNKLATVDAVTMTLTEIELPRAEARPRRLVPTSDGRLWYVDYAGGYLGVHDPAAGTFEEWPAPAGAESRPYAMEVDESDRVWFVETGPSPNRFVGFSTADEEFIAQEPIPSGAGAVRHMDYDPETDSIWFGTDANTIGRARIR